MWFSERASGGHVGGGLGNARAPDLIYQALWGIQGKNREKNMNTDIGNDIFFGGGGNENYFRDRINEMTIDLLW